MNEVVWLLIMSGAAAAVWLFTKPPAVFVVRVRGGAAEATHGAVTAAFLAAVHLATAAHESGSMFAHGRQAHVGIGEEQPIERRCLRQIPASVLLAGPAVRQLRPFQELDTRVGRRDLAHDRRRRIVRAIVEHDHLELDPLARQRCLDGQPDRLFFIPRWDQNRHARPRLIGRRCRRLLIEA